MNALVGSCLCGGVHFEVTEPFERVSAGYRQRAAANPDRFVRIDAQRSPEVVAAQITNVLAARGL